MTKEDYAKKALQWAKALKLLDPTIELILCGKEGKDGWDYHVLKECVINRGETLGSGGGTLIDMHSIHRYTSSEDHFENVTGISFLRALVLKSAEGMADKIRPSLCRTLD